MLSIGLTGGIGSGKSTVANRLAEHGAVVVDADVIAREVVEPGRPAFEEIVASFGEDVLAEDGTLDRAALAEKAFADDDSRARLNGIVHPRVGERTVEVVGSARDDAIVVHDIPLLVEGGLAPQYHLVLVVDAPDDVRVARVIESRDMGEADARARIAAQASEEQRRAAADVWLDNNGAVDRVMAEVDALWADRLLQFEANVRLRRPRTPRSPAIVAYDPSWPEQADRAIARIKVAAGDIAVRVDHMGSTAVPGLAAKDVLDLQLTVSSLDEAEHLVEPLAGAGFPPAPGESIDHMPDGDGNVQRWSKRVHVGADPARPVNLHVRPLDSPAWRLSLLFAAWLRAHPAEREAYEEVKRKLARAHQADGSVDAYATEKQEWIIPAFSRAEQWARQTGWTCASPG